MIPEIGQFALILALAVGIVLAVLPQIGAARGIPQLVAVGKPAAQVQFLFVMIAFAVSDIFSIMTSLFSTERLFRARLPLLIASPRPGFAQVSLLLWHLLTF